MAAVGGQLSRLLKDGDMMTRFLHLPEGQLLQGWLSMLDTHTSPESVESTIDVVAIPVLDLPKPVVPKWSVGPILTGVTRLDVINVSKLLNHSAHANGADLNGYKILASLVGSFDPTQDKNGNVYRVLPSDDINNHHGISALLWLEQNYMSLPRIMRSWMEDRGFLHAWPDVRRCQNGHIYAPSFDCTGPPRLTWLSLGSSWKDKKWTALRESADVSV